MSKRIFTVAQILELSKNINVAKCSDKSITYSKKFKRLAIKQYYDEGYSPKMIFKTAGFNIEIIGKDSPGECLQRWRTTCRIKGISRLTSETRGKHHKGGRPKVKGLTDTDKIKRLEIENAYLKEENDFLVKLRAAKKR